MNKQELNALVTAQAAATHWVPGSMADFIVDRLIGSGGFGQVFLVEPRIEGSVSKYRCVVKRLTKPDLARNRKHAHKEINVMKKMKHSEFFPLYIGHFQQDSLYNVVLSYIEGDNLRVIGRRCRPHGFTTEEVRFLGAEVTAAISQLHSRQIIHEDIKAQNIILENSGHIVLVDFSVSTIFEGECSWSNKSFDCSYNYAPEKITPSKGYSYEVDLWGLGVLLYLLATGKRPFGHHPQRVERLIRAREFRYNVQFESETLENLVHGLLTLDPKERLTIEQVKAHCFFTGIDWDLVAERKATPPCILSNGYLRENQH